jgi:Tol biopolymer transport system component
MQISRLFQRRAMTGERVATTLHAGHLPEHRMDTRHRIAAPHAFAGSCGQAHCGRAARRRRAIGARLALLLVATLCSRVTTTQAETLSLLSVPEDPLLLGVQADRSASSCGLDIAGNAVFTSNATQLVAADRNGESDVFFKDIGGGAIARLSRHADGSEIAQPSSGPSMSDDGNIVALLTTADLIGNQPPGESQVYVLNRTSGAITLVSRSAGGAPGNAESGPAQVDGSGAFVVFSSAADNLVANDNNQANDVFRFDIAGNTLLRVSTDSLGNPSNGHSSSPQVAAGGNVVAFTSQATNLVGLDGNGLQDVFVKDLITGATTRVSAQPFGADADALSNLPSISDDGNAIAFTSAATNIVFTDTNGVNDVFVHTRNNGVTQRVSTDAGGAQGDAASRQGKVTGNGRLVAFVSAAGNLAGPNPGGIDQLYVKDMQTGAVLKLTNAASSIQNVFDFNSSGARICFNGGGEALVPNDTNRVGDLYTITLGTQAIRRVNLAATPHPVMVGNDTSFRPDLSDDGRLLAFASSAALLDAEGFAEGGDPNVVYSDVYVRDNTTGAITRLSNGEAGGGGDSSSDAPAISGDGRFVAFESAAENLVSGSDNNGDNDVFRADTASGALVLISQSPTASAGRGRDVSISDSGDRIAFVSVGDDLVADDTNGEQDVFVWNVVDGIRRMSLAPAGVEADEDSSSPAMSGDGSVVVFTSSATNLVPGDSNGHDDIFVHTLSSGVVERVSVAAGGAQSNGRSQLPEVSRNGRYIAFATEATNLAPGDLDPGEEIVLLDRATGTIVSASAGLAIRGLLAPADPWLSPDGRIVLYRAHDAAGFSHLMRYDRDTGDLMELMAGDPDGNTDSFLPAGYVASADGRLVAFDWIDPLLPADNNDPDGDADIYALRLEPGALEMQTASESVDEAVGTARLRVRRAGGSDGLVRVRYAIDAGSATPGADYTAVGGNLTWADGDATVRFIDVPIVDDAVGEAAETLVVRLVDALGGAGLGAAASTLTILDNDAGASEHIFGSGFEG